MVICGLGDEPRFDWPDAGQGACCIGAASLGPAHCTCWEPVYDLDQVGPTPTAPGLRSEPCEDCAYRGGSPERQGADHVMGDARHLEALVVLNRPFFCHQGIRRPIAYRHPTGCTFTPAPQALEVAYRPPIVSGVPYKADGTPADLCAGWAAARLREKAP